MTTYPDRSTNSLLKKTALEQFNAYLATQLQTCKNRSDAHIPVPPGPAITISRQAGTGAHEIALLAAELLQAREPKGSIPWTVFDRHLLEKVLEEHHLPQALAEFIPEDYHSTLRNLMDEMLGIIPSSWVMVPKVSETVLHLAVAGHAILVGRGANFITARIPNVFRVRLVGSLPKRIERVQALKHLAPEEAAEFIKKEDLARARYVKSNFHLDSDDSLLYHIVINTDGIPCQDTAQLIVDGALMCYQRGTVGHP